MSSPLGGGLVARVLLAGLAAAGVFVQASSSRGAGEATTADGDLIGLWGAEAILGPDVRGEITVQRGDGGWRVRTGGFEASAPAAGGSFRARLPGGKGELRARLERDGRTLHGLWVQPSGDLPAYATPVRFARAGPKAWRGAIEPLLERFSLTLLIDRAGDGSLRARFGNPERRWTGGAPAFRLTRDGAGLHFLDTATGQEAFTADFDAAARAIELNAGFPITLAPRSPPQAPGAFPRSPADPPYEYQVPALQDDGWPTARAREAGLDERMLRDLVRRIAAVDPFARGAPLLHSILVERHGKLVLEEYFFGYSAGRLHDLRSASKSFTSLLAGIAMERGANFTMATPVLSIFPAGPGAADPRKAKITVGELLTHSTGLACDDNDDDSPGNEDTMQSQRGQPDWYRYTLELPMAHKPGTVYAYCSGGTNLAGGVIARTTGGWLPELFDRWLARPLGIRRFAMNLMPDGQGYSGGGVRLRPRDLLKFGELCLRRGAWKGLRVVSERWIRESTSRRMASPSGADGYGWHLNTLRAGGREYREFEANGNGGQFLIVVPELDLAAVITAGNYGQYPVWRSFREELLPKYVLAACTR